MRRVLTALALLLAVTLLYQCIAPGSARVATFNIENYPKSAQQEALAFDAIRSLDAVAIGVQEITDPGAFAAAARRRLGDAWRFVFADRGPEQRVGVLYDGGALELLSARTLRETEVYSGAKPALEARLAPRAGDVLRLIVVHLKAAGDGAPRRREQLLALRPRIIEAMRTGERVVLLGDFNATGDEDRREIAALAEATGMAWASEGLGCTSYWSRRDGCVGTALDHVLTWRAPRGIRARGPCETEGCAARESCPIFHRDVSDHCPVTVDLP